MQTLGEAKEQLGLGLKDRHWTEVVGIGEEMLVDHCNQKIILKMLKFRVICMKMTDKLTFISYANEHSDAYPRYKFESLITRKNSIP